MLLPSRTSSKASIAALPAHRCEGGSANQHITRSADDDPAMAQRAAQHRGIPVYKFGGEEGALNCHTILLMA